MKLLIDVSNLAYRAAYKFSLSDRNGRLTNVIYGVLNSLGHIAMQQRPSEIVLCFDAGSRARKEIYPEYKAQRHKSDSGLAVKNEVARQLPILTELVSHLPVVCLNCSGVEADDLIGVIAEVNKHTTVGIVTSDHDLYQLARPPKHVIIDPKTGGITKLEMDPKHYLIHKVLVGDPSDNIKGVPQVGKVTARRLIEQYGSIREIMKAAKANGKLGSVSFKEALAIVRRNLKLMKIGDLLTTDEKQDILTQYEEQVSGMSLDVNSFRQRIISIGFPSVASRLSEFLIPFKVISRGKSENSKRDRKPRSKGEESASARRAKRGSRRYTPRIRKTTPDSVAVSSRRKGTRATLRTDSRSREGIRQSAIIGETMEARVRRLGAPNTGIHGTPAILEKQQSRQRQALQLLQVLQWPEAVAYLKTRPDEERVVAELVEVFEAKPSFIPSKKTFSVLQNVHNGYSMELPDWGK